MAWNKVGEGETGRTLWGSRAPASGTDAAGVRLGCGCGTVPVAAPSKFRSTTHPELPGIAWRDTSGTAVTRAHHAQEPIGEEPAQTIPGGWGEEPGMLYTAGVKGRRDIPRERAAGSCPFPLLCPSSFPKKGSVKVRARPKTAGTDSTGLG